MNPVFMGIENEFKLYEGGGPVSFEHAWPAFEQRYRGRSFHLGHTAIRTSQGTALYCDDREPEVCTPPIRIARGFVSDIKSSLYVARRELVKFVSDPTFELMGYSMHFNVSAHSIPSYPSRMMKQFGVPLSLLSLHSSSRGIGVRDKTDEDRWEFLTEHIPSEDQAGAFALFLAATILSYKQVSHKLPFEAVFDPDMNYYENLVDGGRASSIPISRKNKQSSITAQEYLETCYGLLKGTIAQLGTKSDVQMLESYIYGREQLSIEQPISVLDVSRNAYARRKRATDPIGKLFGLLVQENRRGLKLDSLHWDSGRFRKDGREYWLGNLEWVEMAAHYIEKSQNPLGDLCSIVPALHRLNDRFPHGCSMAESFLKMVDCTQGTFPEETSAAVQDPAGIGKRAYCYSALEYAGCLNDDGSLSPLGFGMELVARKLHQEEL
jgi:hypothetical protein